MSTNARPALEGVKILDLTRVLAGPWCTQLLADFGADVVKIETPDGGDDTRAWGPPELPPEPDGGAGASAYFLSCNRNKRSVAINLAKPEGAALVRRLAAEADVVIENFKRGGLAKFGLDYPSICATHPGVVYCSITGFGQNGPYADRPGYDFVIQAMGGMMSITGEQDGPPLKPGVALADLVTGMYAAVSVLIALRHAERTGHGQYIDCSLLDTQIAMLANQAVNFLVSGTSPGRLGNAHPNIVPYRVFDTGDGPIVIAVGNNGQFASLCATLGLPELAADPRYDSNARRVRNRITLEAALQARIKERTAAELIERLASTGVPAGPVNTIGQIFADPFVAARGAVHYFERPDGVKVPSVAFPGKLSVTPAQFALAPPRLGEHTAAVLAEWLSLEAGTLAALQQRGVIADAASTADHA